MCFLVEVFVGCEVVLNSVLVFVKKFVVNDSVCSGVFGKLFNGLVGEGISGGIGGRL